MAQCRRLSPLFFKTSTIVPVRPYGVAETTPLPVTQNDWLDLIAKIYKAKGGRMKEIGENASDADRIMHQVNQFNKPRVHCECSLVSFLSQHGDHKYPPESMSTRIRAFSYIGVSKQSCKACHLWLQAYNETQQAPYFTRGAHHKWYGAWAVPAWSKQHTALRKKFNDLVLEEYFSYAIRTDRAS